jgi:hypothetical protein
MADASSTTRNAQPRPEMRKDERILKLGQGGFSRREICRLTGASYNHVCNVFTINGLGRPKVNEAQREQQRAMAAMARPFERCPTCGGKCQLPCLECQLTRRKI